MGLFDFLRRPSSEKADQDSQFASLLVEHALTAAEECMNQFVYEDNCETEADALLMYENLFTIYLALVFACLRQFDMTEYESLVIKDFENRFPGTGAARTSQTAANIYRIRDYLHPHSQLSSFEDLKGHWSLLIRSLLHDYHKARFGKSSFLAIVDEKRTGDFLVQHVARVEAHCRVRSDGR